MEGTSNGYYTVWSKNNRSPLSFPMLTHSCCLFNNRGTLKYRINLKILVSVKKWLYNNDKCDKNTHHNKTGRDSLLTTHHNKTGRDSLLTTHHNKTGRDSLLTTHHNKTGRDSLLNTHHNKTGRDSLLNTHHNKTGRDSLVLCQCKVKLHAIVFLQLDYMKPPGAAGGV